MAESSRKQIPELVAEIEAAHADSLKLRDRLESEPLNDEPILSREIRRRMVEFCGRFLMLLRSQFRGGDSPPAEMLAWLGRCLFELDLRNEWVYRSLENAQAFNALADLQSDKFGEGLKRLHREDKELAASIDKSIAAHKERRKTGVFGILIDAQRMDEVPRAEPKSPTLREIARDLGREDDYVAYYAFHSDFSHPTPLLIMRGVELVHFHPFKMDVTEGALKHAKETLLRLSLPHPGLVEDHEAFKTSHRTPRSPAERQNREEKGA